MIRTLAGNIRNSQRRLMAAINHEERVESRPMLLDLNDRNDEEQDDKDLLPKEGDNNRRFSMKKGRSVRISLPRQKSIPTLLHNNSKSTRRLYDKQSAMSQSSRYVKMPKGESMLGSKGNDCQAIEQELRALVKGQIKKSKSSRKLRECQDTDKKKDSDDLATKSKSKLGHERRSSSRKSKSERHLVSSSYLSPKGLDKIKSQRSERHLTSSPLNKTSLVKIKSQNIKDLPCLVEIVEDVPSKDKTEEKVEPEIVEEQNVPSQDKAEDKVEPAQTPLTLDSTGTLPVMHVASDDTSDGSLFSPENNKRLDLKTTLLRIEARLSVVLDAMHQTRRRIDMIQNPSCLKDTYDESPSDTESLSDDEDDIDSW